MPKMINIDWENEEIVNGIVNTINEISNTNSSKEKMAIMLSLEGDLKEQFKEVLNAVYNPRIVYSLKPFTEPSDTITTVPIFTDMFINTLATRELTGNMARDAYIYQMKHSSAEKKTLINSILDRDLHCGIGVKTINKVFPKLIPEMGYMRCSLPKQIKDWSAWDIECSDDIDDNKHFVQEKLDGMFVNINVYDDGVVQLFTRAGTPIPMNNPSVQNIVNDINQSTTMRGYQIHGEMLVCDETGIPLPREISNGLLNSLIKMDTDKEITDLNDNIFVVAWDMIPINPDHNPTQYPFIKIDSPYYYRFGTLEDFLDDCMFIHRCSTKRVKTINEAYEFALDIIAKGGEGAVFKHCDGKWKNGTSKEQVKLKVEFIVDLEVIAFNEGTGKNKDLFGSIECKTSDGKLVVNVSSSGFTDKHKQEVSDNRDEYIGKIISVKSNNIMYGTDKRPHSLFLPVFVEFRDDKFEADSFDDVVNQLNSVIKQ